MPVHYGEDGAVIGLLLMSVRRSPGSQRLGLHHPAHVGHAAATAAILLGYLGEAEQRPPAPAAREHQIGDAPVHAGEEQPQHGARVGVGPGPRQSCNGSVAVSDSSRRPLAPAFNPLSPSASLQYPRGSNGPSGGPVLQARRSPKARLEDRSRQAPICLRNPANLHT